MNKYKLQYSTIPGKPGWLELTEDFVYKDSLGQVHRIPAGFRWNGASVPRFLWWLIPPYKDPVSNCVHDYLCGLENYPRKQADKEYKKLLSHTNNFIISGAGYLGTRFGALLGIGVPA